MIRKLAEHDELTGLHNRQHFLSQVNQWIDANTHSFVYMFIDLNYFKQINDRFGHTGGDSTLKSVADIIALETPAGTLIGRIGGDEFSIAIRDISPSEAASIANKINQLIRKITLPGFSEPALLSASIGIALFPKHGSSQFQLNLHADMAMYMAKKTKKPVYFYSPEISQALLTVFQKRQYIRDLIDNDGLCLYLQPIFDIHTNLVFSLECLSRVIDNSKRQMISSDELFSYAAQCSMAAELDLHILSLLLRDNQLPQIINNFCVGTDQEHDVNAGIRINFNVSAQSVTEPGFFDRLHALCQENNVGFDQLVIEVTEGENVDDFAKATAFMKKVQSQGGLVALDDFGDGFAGLNYLRTLPFDIVKIDGQFIHNIDQDPIHQVIVNTMIAVCNKLNMKVVVESIETQAELNYCQANGVDMVQGWHLSKEIAISECIYNTNESVASVM
ncbi:MAG: bifunctional diguanylate cyclase/phosphodiesterase, partial [Gammaproteobacteria bacterium]|nr:bifunctional diguanylate cyclase/phosphodiesterase [Gammaproteobacteria bacterium]